MDQQNGKMSKTASRSFLLAHHPFCDKFSHHTFEFKGRRLCLGCFVMYPTAGLALASLLIIEAFIPLDYLALLIAAICLFALNAVRKLVLRDGISMRAHAGFRALLGISLAMVSMSAITAPGSERIYIVVLAMAVAVTYLAFNGKHNMDTCRSCEQYPQFPMCDGRPPGE